MSGRENALQDFADGIVALVQKPSTRDDVVPLYTTAILLEAYVRPPQAKTTWRVVNAAIAERWSWAAVEWIKRQAWKRAAERVSRRAEEPLGTGGGE